MKNLLIILAFVLCAGTTQAEVKSTGHVGKNLCGQNVVRRSAYGQVCFANIVGSKKEFVTLANKQTELTEVWLVAKTTPLNGGFNPAMGRTIKDIRMVGTIGERGMFRPMLATVMIYGKIEVSTNGGAVQIVNGEAKGQSIKARSFQHMLHTLNL